MTTIERERPARRPPSGEPETPVFLAVDGKRARRLRVAAFAVTGLAVLWLVALAAGMLGFGSLPGVSLPELPKLGGGGTPPAQRDVERERRSSEQSTAQPSSGVAARTSRTATSSGTARRSAAADRAASASRKAKPARPSPQRPQPAQPAAPLQPPQAQAPQPSPLTGRERRGLPAPPGHARKTEPAPTPPGRRRGQDTTTTPTTPPPPPPPPGNGKGGPKK